MWCLNCCSPLFISDDIKFNFYFFMDSINVMAPAFIYSELLRDQRNTMESLSTLIFLHKGLPLSSWTTTKAAITWPDLCYDLPRLTTVVWSAFSRSHQGERARKPPLLGEAHLILCAEEGSKRWGEFVSDQAAWGQDLPGRSGRHETARSCLQCSHHGMPHGKRSKSCHHQGCRCLRWDEQK